MTRNPRKSTRQFTTTMEMQMKKIFGLMLLIASAHADATLYHYAYQGYELKLVREPDYELIPEAPIADKTRPAFRIDVWIDTDFLPGGVLADFDYECDMDSACQEGLLRVEGNNRFGTWNDNQAMRFASFKFDANKNISSWTFGLGWDSPWHGPSTTNALDRIEEWHFDGYEWEAPRQGTWKRISPVIPIRKGNILTADVFYWDEAIPLEIGDGTNKVSFMWVLPNEFWGSAAAGLTDSSVAIATGIKDISEIHDASIFEFTDDIVSPVCDAQCDPDGVGDFVIARNNRTGHYGVLQVKKIYDREWENDAGGIEIFHELDGTWWFQTDGTGNFSPEPSKPTGGVIGWIYLCALGALGMLQRRSRRKVHGLKET